MIFLTLMFFLTLLVCAKLLTFVTRVWLKIAGFTGIMVLVLLSFVLLII